MDWWAHEVVLSYDRKFKKLDSLFAADVVGEDRTSNVVEPFAAEKVRFFKGTGEYQVSSSLGRAQICSYELHFVLRKLLKYNFTLEPLRFYYNNRKPLMRAFQWYLGGGLGQILEPKPANLPS